MQEPTEKPPQTILSSLLRTPPHLGRRVKDPLLSGLLLVRDDSLHELVADGGGHGVQEVAEPALHLPHTQAGLVKVHKLCVLAPHGQGLLGGLALGPLHKLQLGHAVKELGQVPSHLRGGGKGGATGQGQMPLFIILQWNPLLWTPWGPNKVSSIKRCPHYKGRFTFKKKKLGKRQRVPNACRCVLISGVL